MPTADARTLSVASLVGHRQVEMAILCLGSLRRAAVEALRLRLHDDGTLTPEDRGRLAAGLGEPEFVARGEADARVEPLLAGRPHLRAFRARNPLALKLVDVVACAGDELAYCDADVLFLRPVAGLFRPPPDAVGAVFMADRQNAYSLRSWQLLRHRLALPRRVNSGVIFFRRRAFDPDLLEWYLSHAEFQVTPVWMEQTCWALLGARAGCRLLDSEQVALPESPPRLTPDLVALHFVGPLRHLLPAYADLAAGLPDERPIEIRTVAARPCGPLRLAGTEVARRLRALRG